MTSNCRIDGETKLRTLASEGLLGRFDASLAADAWVSEEPLGYTAGLLPSFALPPALLTDLRIVYGSCRRVENSHFDAMPWIDTLINDAFSGQTRAEGALLGTAATTRPHQLFLGGDQIYADDVSPLHLVLCNRLAHQLISGNDEPVAPAVEQLHASGQLIRHDRRPDLRRIAAARPCAGPGRHHADGRQRRRLGIAPVPGDARPLSDRRALRR